MSVKKPGIVLVRHNLYEKIGNLFYKFL